MPNAGGSKTESSFFHQLRLCDPVYSISLKDYCLQKLRECEAQVGVEQFQQLMNSIDKSVLQKLNELLNV